MDTTDFHEFERAGWNSAAGTYSDVFAPVTAQAIEPLLDAAGVRADVDTLDVATGPGFVAAAAAKRGARVTGVDFSAEMLREARSRHPGVDFRENDAEKLSFANGAFDAVVMNFGMLHLAEPERAMAEAHRVLRRGGRFAFTVWAPPDEAVGFGIVLRAVEQHGNMNVPLPAGPPFFRFSDPAESRRALEAAGFSDVRWQKIPLVWTIASPEALFDAFWTSAVRTRALLQGQTPEALARIRRAITQAASAAARSGGACILPMPAVLSSATRE